MQILNGVLTGSLETPLLKNAGSHISPQGTAQGFEGPGFISVEDEQLVVKPLVPLYGVIKRSYTIGVKKKME